MAKNTKANKMPVLEHTADDVAKIQLGNPPTEPEKTDVSDGEDLKADMLKDKKAPKPKKARPDFTDSQVAFMKVFTETDKGADAVWLTRYITAMLEMRDIMTPPVAGAMISTLKERGYLTTTKVSNTKTYLRLTDLGKDKWQAWQKPATPEQASN